MRVEWKDVSGYEGYYRVSNTGLVMNSLSNRVINGWNDGRGYRRVTFTRDGSKRYFRVHRLVAVAFIPNPNNLPMVLHGPDDSRDNNMVTNLRWGTHQDNSNDMVHRGRQSKLTGEQTSNVKLTKDKVVQIKNLLHIGELSNNEIGKLFGVHRRTILSIKTNRTWKELEECK